MKNIFAVLIFATILVITSCTKDRESKLFQVGKWQVLGTSERFLDGAPYSIDTFYYELELRKDKTGLKNNDAEDLEIVDWSVEADTIILTFEKLNPSGNLFRYNAGYIILESQLNTQVWKFEYRIKPGDETVWYDGIQTEYLTRIE